MAIVLGTPFRFTRVTLAHPRARAAAPRSHLYLHDAERRGARRSVVAPLLSRGRRSTSRTPRAAPSVPYCAAKKAECGAVRGWRGVARPCEGPRVPTAPPPLNPVHSKLRVSRPIRSHSGPEWSEGADRMWGTQADRHPPSAHSPSAPRRARAWAGTAPHPIT